MTDAPLHPDLVPSPLEEPRPGEVSPFVRNMLIALIVMLYLGVWVFDHEIWAPTEPTVAGIVWEMRAEKDWTVPRIAGMPYLEKPPLYYWLATMACEAGGRLSAGLIRLPSVLLGLACLLIMYRVARRRVGGAAALMAVLMAATFTSFYEYSHRASTDMAANFFAFLCLGIFADTIERPDLKRGDRRLLDLCFAAALAFSFYAKNFYTFLVVLPPVFLWLAWKREWRRGMFIGAMVAVLAAVFVTPWALSLYRAGGSDFLRIVFVDNTVGRFFNIKDVVHVRLGPLNDAYCAERNALWLYPASIVAISVPWTLALGAAVVNLFRRWREVGEFRRFMGLTLIVMPVVLSLSCSRVVEYLTPIFLVEWIILAGFLKDVFDESPSVHPWEREVLWANLLLLAIAAIVAPVVLALLFDLRWALIWLAPAAFFVWYLCVNTERWQAGEPFVCRTLTFVALTFVMALGFLAPKLDRNKTTVPFFNAVRSEVAMRELFTTYCDDRRLPLIPYYLDRKPYVLENREDVFALLRSDHAVAIILPEEFYRKRRADFAVIPHTHTVAFQGKTFFGFVANLPQGAASAREPIRLRQTPGIVPFPGADKGRGVAPSPSPTERP